MLDHRAKIVRSPIQSPIADCDFRGAESWIDTLKRECLNHLSCFALKHLDHLVQTYLSYCKTLRTHRARGNLPLGHGGMRPPDAPLADDIKPIDRHTFLGGLLSHDERKAHDSRAQMGSARILDYCRQVALRRLQYPATEVVSAGRTSVGCKCRHKTHLRCNASQGAICA